MTVPADSDVFIDWAIEEYYGTSVDDGNFARDRRNVRRSLVLVNHEVWPSFPWAFKYKTSTETVAANSEGTLPTDFLSWGEYGGCYINDGQSPSMKWIPYSQYELLKRVRGRVAKPQAYSDAQLDASQQRKVLFYPTNNTSREFIYSYERTPPNIVDGSGGGGSGTDELNLYPVYMRSGVLLQGFLYYMMRDDSNGGAAEQRTIYRDSLMLAKQTERPGRQAPHNLAPYKPRRRRGYL